MIKLDKLEHTKSVQNKIDNILSNNKKRWERFWVPTQETQ